eukprot:1742567-Prymnesium_polylepis.1
MDLMGYTVPSGVDSPFYALPVTWEEKLCLDSIESSLHCKYSPILIPFLAKSDSECGFGRPSDGGGARSDEA